MANARYDRIDAASTRCNSIARHAANHDGVVSLSSYFNICFCFTFDAIQGDTLFANYGSNARAIETYKNGNRNCLVGFHPKNVQKLPSPYFGTLKVLL